MNSLLVGNLKCSRYKKPIVRQLEEKYGGKWRYIPFRMWVCECPEMSAWYVHEGGHDINGSPIDEGKFAHLKALRVYGNNRKGEIFYPEYKKQQS